jgi:FkbM family methyltransferase
MNLWIRKKIKLFIISALSSLGKTNFGLRFNDLILDVIINKKEVICHNDTSFIFSAPNSLCSWRNHTFSSKEPETLDWIDRMPSYSIFWDIGANIGLYSVYAAKKRSCKVWAFEPSIFNLETLGRNIYLNELSEKIHIVPVALSNVRGFKSMRMTTTDWGGALSTFGESFGWDGKDIQQKFVFSTFGLSMTEAVDLFLIPHPDYIKMDVDGIEHLILDAGSGILHNVKGLLVEVNDAFSDQSDLCKNILMKAGLTLVEKRQSKMISGSQHSEVYNQIWSRI